jgi:hypothetical protein
MTINYIETNGYQLVFEPPNSVMWYVLLNNQRVMQAILNGFEYASLSDEDLLKILSDFRGPPVIRDAMLFFVDRDRVAVLENRLWLQRERPDYLAWLEGLD